MDENGEANLGMASGNKTELDQREREQERERDVEKEKQRSKLFESGRQKQHKENKILKFLRVGELIKVVSTQNMTGSLFLPFMLLLISTVPLLLFLYALL